MLNLDITYNEKGQLKCPFISTLNNINQDVKKISTVYTICIENNCIMYKDKRKGIVGKHVSFITSEKDSDILKEVFGEAMLEINSDAFYALLKDYKKNMKQMTLYKDTNKLIVTLDNGTAIQIGRYIGSRDAEYNTLIESMNQFLDTHEKVTKHKDRFTMLSDEQIERVSESILKCMMNDVHIRIAKQLVPGISNKFNVGIFLNIESLRLEGNDEICDLYIHQERKTVDHFHVYKILKY